MLHLPVRNDLTLEYVLWVEGAYRVQPPRVFSLGYLDDWGEGVCQGWLLMTDFSSLCRVYARGTFYMRRRA